MKKQRIGFRIRSVSNLLQRNIDNMVAQKHGGKFTRMQGWIIGYVWKRREEDVFQKDIEEEFTIRRSTATAILQRMEKNGLLTRVPVDYDARLKKIQLTPDAIKEHEKIESEIEAFEDKLGGCIKEEDLKIFFKVLTQIEKTLSKD